MTPTQAELETYARAAAQRYGVPEDLFVWQIGKESSWDIAAKNPTSSAKGLGQFIDSTEKMFGINALDPYQALDTAAKYDAMLFKQTGSWEGALTKYGTLASASQKTKNEFNAVLGGTVAEQTVTDKILGGLRSAWDNSMGGLATDTYKNLTGKGDETSGKWDFTKVITGNIGLIVLGIVVIALAVLSNNTVQGMAKKAVFKK